MSGYYRYPTIFKNQIIFVSEGDLWTLSLESPEARRLTFNRGEIRSPIFSPDGQWIAFSASDEGPRELYVMPAQGGEKVRLTYLNDEVSPSVWKDDGIYFTCSAGQPFQKWNNLFRISPKGGVPEQIQYGPLNFVSFGKGAQGKAPIAIQRHGYREYGYWKRYRGGTAGELWISASGTVEGFTKLIELKSDLARPIIMGDHVYFSSDHEGFGNLYRTNLDGTKLTRVTHHEDYYVRGQSSDGSRIVYSAGGDLFLYDPKDTKPKQIEVTYHSDRPQRAAKFISTKRHLEGYALHPRGHHMALASRGKLSFMGNWEGPVTQLGEEGPVRYRLPTWLHDGERLVALCDKDGEETLHTFNGSTGDLISKPKKSLDIGRIIKCWANPVNDSMVLLNHRHEYKLVDLKKWTVVTIDHSKFGLPKGGDWSPDGKWFAFSTTINRRQRALKIYNVKTKKLTQISNPILSDEYPVFDPEGNYLFFLSRRHFDVTYDNLHFEIGFNHGVKPYAMTLRADLPTPFLKKPEDLLVCDDDKKESKGKKKKAEAFVIDLEGIENRIIEFPVESAEYSSLAAVKGKVYFLSHPLEVTCADDEEDDDLEGSGNSLECYDLDTLKVDSIATNVDGFKVSMDHEYMAYVSSSKVRVLKIGDKPEEERGFNKKSGWIDLSRPKFWVNPVEEWQQMFKEAWRLQRDHFWVEDMSHIDWDKVYKRYEPLLSKVSTRDEFSDLLWEMQGELGTSHAYVWGGDLKSGPYWSVGLLASDLVYDKTKKAYKITKIAQGDTWNWRKSSPLTQPGANLAVGDYIASVNKRALNEDLTPAKALMNLSGQEVDLGVLNQKGKAPRHITVRTLRDQYPTYYRDWVERNRAYVHEKTKGKVGYIHIPDMSAAGYSEFHRSFLMELDRDGLIVDVRFNGGGSVSQLLLEKLARKRLGYDVTRWSGLIPYPEDAPMGPMVALTNEYAGSDGDMFSHNFKTMKLGPLIGKRTWGGVIGIYPRFTLSDGGMTTQPEFSFWFADGGWGIENYGVDPDIEVEITPLDYAQNKDPQMERGLAEIDKLLKDFKPIRPDVSKKPNLSLPQGLGKIKAAG